jgi:DNA-binding IscR family transcriptional regulator
MNQHRTMNGSPWSWVSKAAQERALEIGGSNLLLVYLALCRLESDTPDEAKGCFYASATQIARHSGLATRTVRRVIPKLETAQLAKVVSGRNNGVEGSNVANKYTLLNILPSLHASDSQSLPLVTHGHHLVTASCSEMAHSKELEELKEIEGVVDEKPKRSKSSPIQLPPIPAELDTPAFSIAWDEWIKHRKEKKKVLTASTASKQLQNLSEWGVDASVASIARSIEKGWVGLFLQTEFFPTNDQTVPTLPKSKEPENWVPVFQQLYPNGKSMPWDQLTQLHSDIADEVLKAIADYQPVTTATAQKAA